MANSTNKLFREIEICENAASLCLPTDWEISYHFSSTVTVVMNLLHLVVLRKLELHKERINYYIILFFMAVVDISTCVGAFMRYSCLFRMAVVGKPLIEVWLFITFYCPFVGMQFYVLAIACYDRYVAICKPLYYETNVIINHIGKVLMGLLLFLFFFYGASGMLEPQRMCMDHVVGPFVTSTSDTQLSPAFVSVSAIYFPPISLAVFTSCMMARELKKMKARNVSTDDREVRKAAMYILSVAVAFSVFLLPFLTSVTISTMVNLNPSIIYIVTFGQGLYGQANVIIYGLMYPRYRQTLWNMFKPSTCKQNTVGHI